MAVYLLGKMAPEAKAEFELHLAQCEKCRNQVAEIDHAAKLMKKDLQTEKERQLTVSVQEKARIHRIVFLKYAGLLVLLFTAGYFIFQSVTSGEKINQGVEPEHFFFTDTIKNDSTPNTMIRNK